MVVVFRCSFQFQFFSFSARSAVMKFLTTGQVAKICCVAPRTVSKWIDAGRLRGFRLAGSQDRRIQLEYLIEFLKEHCMPFDNLIAFLKERGMSVKDLETSTKAKVLVVTQDFVLIDGVKRELTPERKFETVVSSDHFDAGIQTQSLEPDAVVVDFYIGREEALGICRSIRQSDKLANTIIIGLLPGDGSCASIDRSCITETFRRPFDPALLATRLYGLIGAKKVLV
jgi:excisionase family DNA binding protein